MIEKDYQLKAGTILADLYEVHNVLGEGGFGITYDAENLRLGMRVAIKEFFCGKYLIRDTKISNEVILRDAGCKNRFLADKKRFTEEALILRNFSGTPGIVQVIDYFEANETAYIVMVYLAGMNLQDYVRENGRIKEDVLMERMKPLMLSLSKIHDAGLIHCDINPKNIMVLPDDSLCLIDFGAFFRCDTKSRFSPLFGTDGYSAPEQYNQEQELKPATDIYSLTATIYYCITGVVPDSAGQRMLNDELRSPKELGVPVSKVMGEFISRGLSILYKDRWKTLSEILSFLDAAQSGEKTDEFVEEAGERTGEQFVEETREESGEHPAEEQEEKPSEGPGREAGKRTGKWKYLSVVFCAMFVFAVIILIRMYEGTDQKGEMYHAALKAREKMTVREYYDALEIIKARLNILSGDADYLAEIKEDEIDIHVPVSAVEKRDLQTVLEMFIGRAGNLYAFNKAHTLNIYKKRGYSLRNAREEYLIKREEIEDIELNQGSLSWVNTKGISLEDPDNYNYIKITFSKACSERLNEMMNEWGDEFCLGLDANEDEWIYYPTYAYGDGRSFYWILDDTAEKYPELVQCILSLESLPKSFDVILDLAESTEWEAVDDDNDSLQRNPEDIEWPSVTFRYKRAAELGELSEEQNGISDLEEISAEIKRRLESLNQPFAYGISEDEQGFYITIKTGASSTGLPLMRLLFSSGEDFNSIIGSTWKHLSKNHFSLERGTTGLILKITDDYEREEIQQLIRQEDNGITDVSFLEIDNDIAVYKTPSARLGADDEIVFTEPCIDYDGGGNNCLIDFIISLWDSSFVNPGFFLDYVQMDENQDGEKTTEDQFGYEEADLAELRELIQGIHPGTEVFTGGKSTLYCILHLPIDSDLPNKGVETAAEIYDAVGFESRQYERMTIVFTDEDGEETERARISFTKWYKYFDGSEPYIEVSGLYYGGQLQTTMNAMQELCESEDFFPDLKHGTIVYQEPEE